MRQPLAAPLLMLFLLLCFAVPAQAGPGAAAVSAPAPLFADFSVTEFFADRDRMIQVCAVAFLIGLFILYRARDNT